MSNMGRMGKKQKIALSVACVSVLSAAFLVTSFYRTFAANLRSDGAKRPTTSSSASSAATTVPTTTANDNAGKAEQNGSRKAAELPDIASLSSKKIGWGQGTNFDSLNRPQDAVNAQEKYGDLGGHFVDLSEKKVIYLTFDEGYENGYSSDILDTLKQKGVKATFFITGDYAKREGELVQRMIDEGHTVGNHTWKHYSMPEKSLDVCREEITQLEQYVQENFHYKMTTLRPPMGEFSEQTLALASEMGYSTWFWSFAYKDWDVNSQTDSATALNKLNNRLHCGAIYLLHAVSPTNAAILGDFIDNARAQGYEFVTP